MDYKADLITFLQTAAGWPVSGESEQPMFILYGTGANGKNTFLNVIQHILGDYAMSTWTETFMKRNNNTATNDIARLRGSRFVWRSLLKKHGIPAEHSVFLRLFTPFTVESVRAKLAGELKNTTDKGYCICYF
jgi:phage/plasmid-associated DNA primase